MVALLGAACALAAATAGKRIDAHVPASRGLFAYGLVTAFAALFIAQFIDDFSFFEAQKARSTGRLLLLAVITLAGLLAAMSWALQTDNRGALWIAYTAFALEIYALYWRTLGSLLDTSLFFLVAAVLVSTLAWAAYLLHRRKLPAGAVP